MHARHEGLALRLHLLVETIVCYQMDIPAGARWGKVVGGVVRGATSVSEESGGCESPQEPIERRCYTVRGCLLAHSIRLSAVTGMAPPPSRSSTLVLAPNESSSITNVRQRSFSTSPGYALTT